MASSPNSITMEELDLERNGRAERSQWLLHAPEPPGLVSELMSSIRETVFPNGNKFSSSVKKQPVSKTMISVLKGIFPILCLFRNYKAAKFKNDLMAGLTLASLSIPQSIGYANLAKLDPQFGLYTSVIPPLIYAFMGSSREIAIGPVAVVSLLISSMIQDVVDPSIDPTTYKKIVFTVTFFAGIFQASFGLLRLGFLVDFLSHAAIVGFMGGAAIVIGMQQLKGLLGISHFTTKTDIISVLASVWRSIHHPGRRNKKLFWLPAIAPLVSVVLSTLLVFLTRADKHGVKIIKHIKGGLNPSSAQQLQFNGSHLGKTVKSGLIIAIVALTEAIAVGRSFASIKGYHIDGNKEMVAMGFMNIAGSLSSCYVATGSFSRTAVNFSAGCETVVSNIVMVVTVIICLELFTRLLYFTPVAILASIILSALPGLIDVNEAYNIWKIDKLDFLACIGAFLGVLFASVEVGLVVAVLLSIMKIILNSIRPGIQTLGRLPETEIFCNINQYKMAIKTPGVLIIRIDTDLLCFSNANYVRERIMRCVSEEKEESGGTEKGTTQALILDMTNLSNIDTSGILVLQELHKKLLSIDIELAMVNPSWKVTHKLKLAKFIDEISEKQIFLTVGEAVDASRRSKIVSF
ncbi:hypothetical protein GIB67_022733 [Kingdonia uniflora]|uniref:STAS domain-containing protein n=1 Tax=Kingdonia uniflora TaxID=39325 RepID=A0A7J7P8D7_9MAGN|nr:hypothetical protein GIB67_022733 [Kingdonia uniflora]